MILLMVQKSSQKAIALLVLLLLFFLPLLALLCGAQFQTPDLYAKNPVNSGIFTTNLKW